MQRRSGSACGFHRLLPFSTAGQEDPFELDSNLRLSAGQQDEVRKRQCSRLLYLLMHTNDCMSMGHLYLLIWLTYWAGIVLVGSDERVCCEPCLSRNLSNSCERHVAA